MCSASDFPLMTSAEMGAAMGTFVESRVNFITGSAMMEQNRAELYVDDQVWERVSLVFCRFHAPYMLIVRGKSESDPKP